MSEYYRGQEPTLTRGPQGRDVEVLRYRDQEDLRKHIRKTIHLGDSSQRPQFDQRVAPPFADGDSSVAGIGAGRAKSREHNGSSGGTTMPSPGFTALRDQVFALYAQRAWQEALVLLDQVTPAWFAPAEAASIVFWQTCFLALLGRSDAALDTLEAGLQQGLWWAEQRLRLDPDLRSLQGLPRLEAVIAACRARCAEAGRHVQPARLVAEPPDHTQPPYPLLLALHGYDETAAAALPAWAPVAAHGWLVAALQSGQLAGMAGYHWMDEARTQRDVRQHLDALAATYPLDLGRLAIGGFSNGGRAALLLALTGAIPATRVISVGAMLRDETLAAIDWQARGSAGAPRVLWIVGDQDTALLPCLTGQAELFRQNGVDVTVQVVPGLGHALPPDLASRVAAWLQGDARGS